MKCACKTAVRAKTVNGKAICRKCKGVVNFKSGSKYSNAHPRIDNITFDSNKEARRYAELKLMEKAGEIQGLRVHVSFPLEINGVLITAYEADFVYGYNLAQVGSDWVKIVEDAKGYRTESYKIKRNLMKAILGIEILET